jgi:hypothetical protein
MIGLRLSRIPDPATAAPSSIPPIQGEKMRESLDFSRQA